MPHLVYRLPLLTLLLAGVAAAHQQSPPPVLRQKSVTLPASARDAIVHVARGTLTTFTFDSELASIKGLNLAGRDTHFERVVVEERTLTLKPKVNLAPGERLVLTVRFADGAAPQEATFELVASGEEVDAAVEVVRRSRTADALEAALASTLAQLATLQARCGDNGPESAVLSGWLTEDIRVRPFSVRVPPGNVSGLRVESGASYRTSKWALVVIQLHNAPGAQRWALGELRLTSAHGAPVKVLSARFSRPQLGPGEKGLLLVRTEVHWWMETEELRLELKDHEGGLPLYLSGVKF